MLNEYDRPIKGYKTSSEYEHPSTVLYDNFAPKVEEEIFVNTAEEISETPNPEMTEEITEEKEGEE